MSNLTPKRVRQELQLLQVEIEQVERQLGSLHAAKDRWKARFLRQHGWVEGYTNAGFWSHPTRRPKYPHGHAYGLAAAFELALTDAE